MRVLFSHLSCAPLANILVILKLCSKLQFSVTSKPKTLLPYKPGIFFVVSVQFCTWVLHLWGDPNLENSGELDWGILGCFSSALWGEDWLWTCQELRRKHCPAQGLSDCCITYTLFPQCFLQYLSLNSFIFLCSFLSTMFSDLRKFPIYISFPFPFTPTHLYCFPEAAARGRFCGLQKMH